MENPNFSPYFYTLRCGFNRFYIKIHLKVTIKHRGGNQKASLIIGAADSATGTADLNQRLSEDRADYISDQLMALGLNSDHIEQQALGGIEEFTPIANNRYCKIQLIPLNFSTDLNWVLCFSFCEVPGFWGR